MTPHPPSDPAAPRPGLCLPIAPGVRRILAPNPSPMTYWGTNTYLVGQGAVTVIDPGPDMPAHLDAILAGLDRGERIDRILVTHAHIDHSPLARPLALATGAPVCAFGPAEAGRSAEMARLAAAGLAGGGEGIDSAFRPDVTLGDGDSLPLGDGQRLTALWTPGHLSNHLCFALGDMVFTGDHVMGWASTLISPPDGDLDAFLDACARLATRRDRLYLPGHGAPVEDPPARLAWLVDHRRGREAQILAELDAGPATCPALTGAIYTDTDPRLLAAAERNVFAHLIALTTRGIVEATPQLAPNAVFARKL